MTPFDIAVNVIVVALGVNALLRLFHIAVGKISDAVWKY